MIAEAPRRPIAPRATDRPGDASPFALGLLLRRAHWRAAAVMTEALRPLGIEWVAAAPRAALRTVTLDEMGADPAVLGAACLAALADA